MLLCSDILTLKRAIWRKDGAHSIILVSTKWRVVDAWNILQGARFRVWRERENKKLNTCTIYQNIVAFPLNICAIDYILVINRKCLGFGFGSLFLGWFRQFGPFFECKLFVPMMRYSGDQLREKRTARISKWNAAIRTFVSLVCY